MVALEHGDDLTCPCVPDAGIVSRGITGAIQKDLEAIGLQPRNEGAGIGCSVAPRIRYEKIIAEDEVEDTTRERAASIVAGVRGGKQRLCRDVHEKMHLRRFGESKWPGTVTMLSLIGPAGNKTFAVPRAVVRIDLLFLNV